MTAELDRAVANALGLKSVNDCDKWRRTMDDDDDTQVYKKPWVGLTDEQRLMALKFIDPKTARLPQGFKQFAEAIEKLLKDQNT